MLSMNNIGQIRLSRGDDCRFELLINQGTAIDPISYILEPSDEVFFGVMEPNQPFEYAILKKRYTAADLDSEGKLWITLLPQDTLCLLPGLYYYQIKVRVFNSLLTKYDVMTLNPKTQFWIEE